MSAATVVPFRVSHGSPMADVDVTAWEFARAVVAGAMGRSYAVFQRSGATEPGRFSWIGEGDETPDGWELVTGESLPTWRGVDAVAYFMRERMRRLPLYPLVLRSSPDSRIAGGAR